MAESDKELKSLLMRVKEESEKAALKLNIKNTKIMASGSITSWQIEGEKVDCDRFYFLHFSTYPCSWNMASVQDSLYLFALLKYKLSFSAVLWQHFLK